MSEAFTVAPEVVYSPIVPVPLFVTNRFEPDAAIPYGLLNPATSEAFTVAPEVEYSLIVSVTVSATNRFDPDTAMPSGNSSP